MSSSPDTSSTAVAVRSGNHNPLARFGGTRAVAPLTAFASMIALYVIGVVTISGFSSLRTIDAILILSAFLGIAGVGETAVILLGGIDLSIPFVMDMANVLSAQLNQNGWPFIAAGVVAIVVGGMVGALNGWLSSRLRVHPLIVTLGIGYVAQGAVQMWTNGAPSGLAPGWLSSMTAEGSRIAGLQFAPVILVWAALSILVVFVLRRTSFGRRLYATGNNPTAANFAGLSIVRVWTWTFSASGVFAAIAGIALLGFDGGTLASVGDPYLFLAVGAVVVGGTSLAGGRGGYGGTIIGALMLTILSTILVGVGFSASVQQLLVGAIIIVVVATFGREAHVRDRV